MLNSATCPHVEAHGPMSVYTETTKWVDKGFSDEHGSDLVTGTYRVTQICVKCKTRVSFLIPATIEVGGWVTG